MRLTGILLVLLLTTQVGHAFEPEKWALMQRAVLVDQDANQIKALVASGVDLNNPVWRGNVDLVRYLLGEPGVLLDELNVDGRTPLMIAVEKGNRQIFDMLLAAGANPKIKNARGLDANGMAQRLIEQQQLFQARLKQHSTGR